MIRSVAPGDLWSLRRKPRNQVVLYTEGLLAQTHRPALFALRCMLQGNGRDQSTAVYQERGGGAVIPCPLSSHACPGRQRARANDVPAT